MVDDISDELLNCMGWKYGMDTLRSLFLVKWSSSTQIQMRIIQNIKLSVDIYFSDNCGGTAAYNLLLRAILFSHSPNYSFVF